MWATGPEGAAVGAALVASSVPSTQQLTGQVCKMTGSPCGGQEKNPASESLWPRLEGQPGSATSWLWGLGPALEPV